MASRAMKIDPKKAVSSEPKPQPESQTSPRNESDRAIEVRAYELWCARGCPDGSPEVDWYQAEEELRGNAA